MNAQKHTHSDTHTHTHTHSNVHTHTKTHRQKYTNTHTHTKAGTHATHTYTHAHKQKHTLTHKHISTHAHTQKNTNVQTQTQSLKRELDSYHILSHTYCKHTQPHHKRVRICAERALSQIHKHNNTHRHTYTQIPFNAYTPRYKHALRLADTLNPYQCTWSTHVHI